MQQGQRDTINCKEFSFNRNDLSKNEKYTLEYLFHHFVFNGQPFLRFKQVSKEHLELGVANTITIITGKKRGRFCYNKALNGLIEKGIIERTDFYSKEQGIAKSLRFTRDFVRSQGNAAIMEEAVIRKRKRSSNKLRRKTDTAIRKLNLKKGIDINKLVESIVNENYVLEKYIEVDIECIPDRHYEVLEDGRRFKGRYLLKQAQSLA